MTERNVQFEVSCRSGHARRGELATRHGIVQTPVFMPVATQASVKSLSPAEVAETGARMVIMNTYHLWLRPGPDVVDRQGKLHQFSRWPNAIVTDSGGFQAFSLAKLCKLSEEGFAFASHIDGSRHLLSPEESMRVQGLLGSDIAMQLDVCPPGGADERTLVAALERTTRWAERCFRAKAQTQALFGIIQGGTNVALRLRHAEELGRLPFDGLALGGFSVGEPNRAMHETLREVVPAVDPHRPRYLMGVGTPEDLLKAIGTGVDVFDCVMPTRNARNGQAFVHRGRLSIKQARYRDDPLPLEPGCTCSTCAGGYSRAYLRHLYVAKELLCHRLLSVHNLHFYGELMRGAREAIEDNQYADYSARRLEAMAANEQPVDGEQADIG